MKKKIAYCIFTAAFFAVCLIPSVGMILKGESQPAANEILAQRPQLIFEDGTFNRQITDDLTSYIADRFAFRQEMITGYAAIQAAVFRESSSEDVILGKDGWLFYRDTSDDYLHRSTLSDRSIQGIARTLKLMQEYALQQGTSFLFTVAPNKNSLTPASEMMPDIGKIGQGKKNLQKLEDAVQAQNICYMPLTELLSAGKDGKSYYHRLDSHWNNMGAAVAAEALASKLNISIYPWTQESYSIVKNHKGDLYEMLYPAGKRLDENIEFHRKFSFRYLFRTETDPVIPSSEEKTEAEINGTDYYSENRPPEDNIKIETVSGEDTGNLLMFRDSFGNALYPFMADTFSYSAFSRLIPYRMDWLDEGEFDYIVVEIVERNLKNLASKAPVMPAPIISSYNDISEDSGETEKGGSDQTERITVAGNGKNHVRTEVSVSAEMPGYCMISGTYDPAGIDENTRVFIDTGDTLYEACPVGTGMEEQQTDACFTAYLPEEVLNGSDFSVILCKNGKFLRNSCETVWK